MNPAVVVFDYGSGNLPSAARALETAGARVTVTADTAAAARADALVVPGVGAFAACMEQLRAAGGDTVIAAHAAAGTPILGICVGAQILFDAGTEHGVRSDGLSLFEGEITALRAQRVPHMGWNTVHHNGMPLFEGLDATDRFYFVHSYAAHGTVAGAHTATCDYGEPFVAAVSRDNIAGTQFHPEKSGACGLRLLSNWVRSIP